MPPHTFAVRVSQRQNLQLFFQHAILCFMYVQKCSDRFEVFNHVFKLSKDSQTRHEMIFLSRKNWVIPKALQTQQQAPNPKPSGSTLQCGRNPPRVLEIQQQPKLAAASRQCAQQINLQLVFQVPTCNFVFMCVQKCSDRLELGSLQPCFQPVVIPKPNTG